MDPKDHFIRIYQAHARAYHELIAYEDVDGNLRQALTAITPFTKQRILDLGTGTGRIPLLFPEVPVIGLDLHRAMLLENQHQQQPDPGPLVEGDMRFLPLPRQTFEIITAGWALGHFTGWFPADWKQQAAYVLEEMQRVVVPGGVLIILETMTTGALTPAPPNASLAAYYEWLQGEWGFHQDVIQTDYLFDDLDQAIQHTAFFFGNELANQVRQENWVRLPEWTGIWSKRIGSPS